MAIALLGGTFDPVHNAHLAMARAALAALPASKVVFLPTGPTKYRQPAVAAAADRLEMLRLALGSEFEIDERELAPDASGYTVDTLKNLKKEMPNTDLYFLMGADQLAKLDRWHRPDEVRKLAKLAVFSRPGYEKKDPRIISISMTPLDISASDVRARVSRGESIADLVPPAVAHYIQKRKLYR